MRNFREVEFTCKCGCGLNNYDRHSAEMLDDARDVSATPYIITSGCRCENHNRKEGGSETSSHLANEKPSTAWDLRVNTSFERFMILRGLIDAGFTRLGIAKNFIHVDNDKDKAPCVTWLY